MNLQQLYYFKMIAEMEHYTKAAEALNVNQSSLSHAMQSLENELNVKLFMRSGRNIVLSSYGRMFLPHVKKALVSLDEGVTELRHAIDPEKGIVTLACLPSLAQFVPDIIVRYVSATNRVDVRLQTGQESTYYALREMLLNGKVDLAIATEIDDPRVGSTFLGEHSFSLLVPKTHRFADRESIDISEIDGENFIAFSKDCQIRRQSDEYFRKLGIRPRITTETAQDIMIFGLVSAGHGIAITPWPLGGAPYNVKVIPLQGVHKRRLYLMWNKENYLPPSAAQFRDFIIAQGAVFDEYRLRNNIR
ncbi:MAG: LysR family transcriptional regulator [Oscillospiraceae bacterium]|nr:LysR family transcriptional regulator [Oscillospiraceae bacterium]